MNKSSLEISNEIKPSASELLKRLEEHQKLFELTPDVICTIDAQGRFVSVNAAAEKLWGYMPEELVGTCCFDMVVEEDKGFTISLTRDIINGSYLNHFENRFIHRDGSIVWLSWSVHWDKDEQLIHGIARDISWRNHYYEELLGQKEQLKRACQVASLGIWSMDFVNNRNYSSDELFLLYGLEKGNRTYISKEEFFSLVHPDDMLHLQQNLAQLHHQSTHTFEHRLIRKNDGTIIYLQHYVQVIKDKDQQVICIHAATRDITETKNALDEVMKLSTVVQETSNSVIITDPFGLITWVNKAFTTRTEYTIEEVIGKRPSEVLHGPETCRETREYIGNSYKNKVPYTCEILNYTKSGKKQWVEIKGQPILDEKGELKHFFSIQTDITARKEAEEAIRESEERYKLLFYGSPSAKWIFNAKTFRIIEVNDAACTLYGYSREEFLHLSIPDLKVEEERPLFAQLVQHALNKEDETLYNVVRHQKKSGEIFQVEINAHVIKLLTGYHLIVTGYDMTERLALQKKIIEEQVTAQREVTKAVIQTQEKERGIISKELHDNVNQILTAAKLCIENTRYYPEQSEVFTTRGITMIQNAIREIRSLSKALVSPAVYESGLKVNMLEMLDQYRNLQRFEIDEELEFVEDDIDNELKLTIYRIVQELMNNTVKYAEATKVEVCIEQQGRLLTVLTRDNGKGFDVNSKKDGLGLANIKSRVELFNGTVEVQSSAGNGCKTLIVFPL